MKARFAYLLLGLLIFFACRNTKCGERTETQHLQNEDKAKVPYKDSTKLTFIQLSTGDTHTFVGQGYITDFGSWIKNPDDECPLTTKLERHYQIYTSPSFPSVLITSLQPFFTRDVPWLKITFNNTSYIQDVGGLDHAFAYDSLTIQKKKYYQIVHFQDEYTSQYNSKYSVFYNTTYGILRMETADGDTWELLKME